MRIKALLALSFLMLTACSSGQPVVETPKLPPDVKAAERYCAGKGYVPHTYDFQLCFNNRPEVQAYERNARLGTMRILTLNKSPRSWHARSYPVQ